METITITKDIEVVLPEDSDPPLFTISKNSAGEWICESACGEWFKIADLMGDCSDSCTDWLDTIRAALTATIRIKRLGEEA